MKRTHQLAARFREVVLHGTWIANTNYHDQLSHTGWEMAVSNVNGVNTISALAQHIHYYINGLNQVLNGGTLDIKDQYSFTFPPILSQMEWEAFLTRFWDDAATFAHLVELLPDERLDDVFIDEKYGTYQRNIDGMIEHCYYHLGQIVLLKKLQTSAQ